MELKVWEVPTGKELLSIPANEVGSGGPLVFTADGQWLACAGFENTTAVLAVRTGKRKFAVPQKHATLFYNAGYQGQVQLAYTPGGSLAVHDGEDVRFLDPRTGQEQRKIAAKGFNAEFSPDRRYLALRSETGTIRALDLDSGAQLWQIPIKYGHIGIVLKYSPDGQRLAFMFGGQHQSWDLDNIRLLDATTGDLRGTLPNKHWKSRPYDLSFSPDGQRLAVCHGQAVEVWNLRQLNEDLSARELTDGMQLRGHTSHILDVAFPPASRQLLTVANTRAPAGSPAWEIKRWDTDGGFAVATVAGQAILLNCAAFDAKAERVAVGETDETVRLCDTQTGRELLRAGLDGTPIDLAFGPGGDFLAVLIDDDDVSRIVILDASSGMPRRVIEPHQRIEALAVSPDGRSVAGTGALVAAQVWSVETGETRWQSKRPPKHSQTIPALAFSPNGLWLAGNTTDTTVTFWDAKTGDERVPFIKVYGSDITALAFSADSERLATASRTPHLVKVWDTRSGQEVYSGKHSGTRLYFGKDNRALAISHGTMFTLLSAAVVPDRTYLEGWTSHLAVFSPDGRLVAATGPENDILLFDAFTGKSLRGLDGHAQPIAALQFSDDGKRLLSASYKDPYTGFLGVGSPPVGERPPPDFKHGEVMVWNVETGEQLALFGKLDNLVGVALSADGARVAAQCGTATLDYGRFADNKLLVWDVRTGQRLRVIAAGDRLTSPTFTDGGKVVAGQKHRWTKETGYAMEFLGWSVETGDPVKVTGAPIGNGASAKRTQDGRRLWSLSGKFFIQRESDQRERERLEAQARPDPAWHVEKARAAEGDKQWFAASFHMGRLLLEPKSRDDLELLCRRARANMGLKSWKEAGEDCEAAVRLHPKSALALVTRAFLEYRQDQRKQAHADLASAATVAPGDPAVAASQAFLYLVDKQDEKAAAAEKRMLMRLPLLLGVTGIRSDVAGRDPDPLQHESLAWTMLHQALTQRLVADPESIPLLRLRGVAWATQSKFGWLDARHDFEKAAELAPKDLLAWKGVACLTWQGQWRIFGGGAPKWGLHACDKVLDIEPNAWEFWYLRGLFCAVDRQHAPAIEAFGKALKLHPDFVPAFRERGEANAQLGQWADAAKDFERAAERTGPTDPALWQSLALAQLASGDPAAYQKTCARMRTMFGRTPPVIWAGGALAAGPLGVWGTPLALHTAEQAVALSRDAAEVTALCCSIRPDTLKSWQGLLPLTKRAGPEVRAMVLCRMGRYDEAVKLLEPLRTVLVGPSTDFGLLLFGPTPTPAPLVNLQLALVEHARGRTAEAKKLLEKTITWLDEPQPDWMNPKQKNRDARAWTEGVQIDELCRELKSLLK
jgi:WD40 repeat protein/tetratricopeptide (TPR) repeat protein